MNSTKQAVDFLGYQIDLIQDDKGKMYVPLKRLCEILGIDHKWQMKKVKTEEIFDERVLPVLGEDGRHRNMVCLPLKQLYFWMFRVDPNIVRPEIVERLLEHQKDAKLSMEHLDRYSISINPQCKAELIEAELRGNLDRIMDKTLPDRNYPRERRFELLRSEIAVLKQFENEPPRYKDKALECIAIAINKYREWQANFEKDTSPDAKLEKMDELRSLEKDYRDLHSVKDDLLELCGRLGDREPELRDQLYEFFCRVHERCEAIYSLILDLKEDLGCRYYWQVPCDNS